MRTNTQGNVCVMAGRVLSLSLSLRERAFAEGMCARGVGGGEDAALRDIS